MKKTMYVFIFQKYDKFWSVSLEHFIIHKSLISEEWWKWAEQAGGKTWSKILMTWWKSSVLREYFYKRILNFGVLAVPASSFLCINCSINFQMRRAICWLVLNFVANTIINHFFRQNWKTLYLGEKSTLFYLNPTSINHQVKSPSSYFPT